MSKKHINFINTPSSQTLRSYLHFGLINTSSDVQIIKQIR
jgi:hypothetical protein